MELTATSPILNFGQKKNIFTRLKSDDSSDPSFAANLNEFTNGADAIGAKGFLQTIVESVKNFCKRIRHSPMFSWIFDIFKRDDRSEKALSKAISRNNARTEADLVKYHQDLVYNEKSGKGIYKAHFAPGDKPKTQVVLFLGHCQTPSWSEENAGVLKLYNKLVKDNDCDVILCRVGCAMTDLKHRYGLDEQADLKPEVVLEHVSNLLQDRNASRGIFSKQQTPRNVVIAGYSWGAGLSKEILDRWNRISNGVKVTSSVSLDAIEYGIDNFGDELKCRPKNSEKHLNICQKNDLLLNGTHLEGIDPAKGDASIDVEELNKDSKPQHNQVDDDPIVIEKIYQEIRSQISKTGALISQEA